MHRRAVLTLASTLLATTPLDATWSIILIDTRTKEIAIGSATCLGGYDLKQLASIVRVGVGAAAAQSYVDTSGRNRLLIWNELQKSTDPAQILVLLANQDAGHQTRQYGIADTEGRMVGFTGTQAGAWAGHLTGKDGSIVYALQGNVLTGQPVLQKAERAILDTPGDLAAKLMAAMEAAYSMGGDGRCSCASSNPTGCGSPPRSFTKSAHIGYMVVARQGDTDGVCNTSSGCASGSYYFNENVAFQSTSAPDPVFQLRQRFDLWRQAWIGRPDHHLSRVFTTHSSLPADGKTKTSAWVVVRDWRGLAVDAPATRVSVTLDPASAGAVTIGTPVSLGAGVFEVPLTAGSKAGTALLRVEVDDGKGKVLLSPRTAIEVSGDPLWVSAETVSPAVLSVPAFVLRPGANVGGRFYLVLASISGSSPGIRVSPNVVVPVNPDPVFDAFLYFAAAPVFAGLLGKLDAQGEARFALPFEAGFLRPLAGRTLTFAFASLEPIDFASNPVEVRVQ